MTPVNEVKAVVLTRPQRGLLAAVGNEGDGWYADITRVHRKHLPDLMLLKQCGLVTFEISDTRVRITDEGRAALQQSGATDAKR